MDAFFGPPWARMVSSLVYAFLALSFSGFVLGVKYAGWAGSWYDYFFVQEHVMKAETWAALVALSALAAVFRASMRGVRVRPDWVEYRDVVGALWPKVKRYRWAQIDQVNFFEGGVSLDLWDSTKDILPWVKRQDEFERELLIVARARGIPVTGVEQEDSIDDLDSIRGVALALSDEE